MRRGKFSRLLRRADERSVIRRMRFFSTAIRRKALRFSALHISKYCMRRGKFSRLIRRADERSVIRRMRFFSTAIRRKALRFSALPKRATAQYIPHNPENRNPLSSGIPAVRRENRPAGPWSARDGPAPGKTNRRRNRGGTNGGSRYASRFRRASSNPCCRRSVRS